ncbi:hypothetical protein [Arachidicoccus ginsenosidimutans]|uniref:hypothetical protein n=1 Tax=Arachidicoccus sp. BS20 TaxID=1850526 RepID=UPI0012E83036|nr:hypothetical protein [Arachidicoccus sp. BS20]
MKASRIIRTCFDIMMTILSDDKKASFAFIGSPVFINHLQMESIENTKRFSIYRYVAINLIGRKSFELFEDEQTSCFLIANKLSDIDIVRQEANMVLQSMF